MADSYIEKIVKKILEVAHPEQIILFGSRALNSSMVSSDYDILVIEGHVHRRNLAKEIYRSMVGFEHPVDIVVVHPEDVERNKDNPYSVISDAIKDGKLLYAR
ncbi:MAG: nucleotidyltransferase domain-containing protein [Bacteroidia bacterium]|nr:nucleotidyltransferase domain-containing protein [Bacteroidia bacterium]